MSAQTGSYAKVIRDSITPLGDRLTTFEVCFHRFVLAEFNTHCVLSRNSASSRAIPTAKQVTKVWDSPALPVLWPEEQKGMQGGGAYEDTETIAAFEDWWLEARDASVKVAERLRAAEVHKSVTNRLLEPFMWHTVVVTATAWENFFLQRCSPNAQPEIRVAAEAMQAEYRTSEPRLIEEGEGWHLPYIEAEDIVAVQNAELREPTPATLARISAARCARVSYLTQDGKRDISADLNLYDRLTTAQPAHWSPLEHVATPWAINRQTKVAEDVAQETELTFRAMTGEVLRFPTGHLPRVGKLLGWRSLRTEVEASKGAKTYC